ncbi:hypothetical protein AArcSl_1457 [Halalkaliarchaeum desulfuricum]|uniref:Uncharacterized protein n=1 Tax=Halalkaliarchaeum desulfuricum TaxID=2055893 RepID=A0A343TJ15_9EURY|nr:hypothetical protein AArcSl_1457 [Halalkaliarchaeum desulfuricum]
MLGLSVVPRIPPKRVTNVDPQTPGRSDLCVPFIAVNPKFVPESTLGWPAVRDGMEHSESILVIISDLVLNVVCE